MKRYTSGLERRVLKQLEHLPDIVQERVTEAIRKLEEDPRPVGYIKLKGREACRIRVGDYRVVYEIDDDKLALLIVTIMHRKDVYRPK